MDWQRELYNNIREANELLPYINCDETGEKRLGQILEHFPMSVTRYYLSLIDFSNENDPIRKMAIPSMSEADMAGSFDTSGEAQNTVLPGLQHKYAETALILSTNQCAVYCRHCFRKRLVGISDEEVARQSGAMRDYIFDHKEINNVMISGGDALMNSNARLGKILGMLADIPHVDTVRICSRVPVVFPQRILEDWDLMELLIKYNRIKQLHFVTQFNHPREITMQSAEAVRRILRMGIPVKNQAVLLRGVNDDMHVLGSLLRGLTRIGAEPYYIFQCRPTAGVMTQFQVPILEGARIVRGAAAMQNGLGKTFHHCMSTVPGKLEILGEAEDGKMLFRYQEAVDKTNLGRIFAREIAPGQTWLEE